MFTLPYLTYKHYLRVNAVSCNVHWINNGSKELLDANGFCVYPEALVLDWLFT